MKIRELTMPYIVQEVDYTALSAEIEAVFGDEFGAEQLDHVRVAHFNPDVIDVTVYVQNRTAAMDLTALKLGELFSRQGIRVAMRVAAV